MSVVNWSLFILEKGSAESEASENPSVEFQEEETVEETEGTGIDAEQEQYESAEEEYDEEFEYSGETSMNVLSATDPLVSFILSIILMGRDGILNVDIALKNRSKKRTRKEEWMRKENWNKKSEIQRTEKEVNKKRKRKEESVNA